MSKCVSPHWYEFQYRCRGCHRIHLYCPLEEKCADCGSKVIQRPNLNYLKPKRRGETKDVDTPP